MILDTNKNLIKEAKFESQITFSSTATSKAEGANSEKDDFMTLAQEDNDKTIFRMLTDHKRSLRGWMLSKCTPGVRAVLAVLSKMSFTHI